MPLDVCRFYSRTLTRATKSGGSGKEANASFWPLAKPQVIHSGSDGNNKTWPNLVVEVAYSQLEVTVINKIKNHWLRAHDAILIKIEPPIAPTTIPVFMTARHYCINNQTAAGTL
ncbi:hypothetical protein C1645_827665 [Glomus cerebriforme]|uniref:Uncharacterized protein n=1 Tax=Glomus cerebriforme TaxID=658196 RepID=A0A397SXN4_9GLOM|nr:hypothetical protein C1645_827665 [Glomus cerebriforme]